MMEVLTDHINEQNAAEAFTGQSVIFDDLYGANTIINYKRERVRDHVLKYLKPGSSILELNSGTGEDAIFFAGKGHKVHATDISPGMQQQLMLKVQKRQLGTTVSNELCSYTDLNHLKNKGPYDLVFSNFAGLNCTGELDKVLASLSPLLNPGGLVTLVVLPKFCLWETLLLFKGKFKTAFRRFFSSNGRTAHIDGNYFKCWYYNPSYITKRLKGQFDVLSIEGLCTIVPPSYLEGFAEKHPSAYTKLKKWEGKLKTRWPWRVMGDYYIISLRKK
ncbi:class I SAM-dependent methyltransferase [Mucilaginibacter sp. McL0603]|uniref:class I SAM-dependent methyltransferase n=1 Tax=Mucilaginibacter sp. McL0603 TaxID=3415670 RepID=UPI003CE9FE53